ncbi:unnamed protein product [Didymodactylos carnosus]|uniref:Secreted protein n=1 Tax=Didymodactylos carnosus TaxID=1234261 RepID=A0A8S2ENE3_9BILA|nr:unnamed protein product [Didymodactylos carnosus]CAF4038278.1 unnamed protein product [Didymodactylos carnosus]
MSYTLFLLTLLYVGIATGRNFRFVSQCTQTIWIGVQGKPLIENGGFKLAAKSSRNVFVPDAWEAGRFWPRTGCRNVNGQFKCATGSKYNGRLQETTILPRTTCTFNANLCPPELQMDDGAGGKVCASVCAAINNAGQRATHQQLQNIYNNEDTRSLVCCSCERSYCIGPHDKFTQGGKCYVERWPRSTDNRRYDEVFKSQCPDANSWQFDDLAKFDRTPGRYVSDI